MYLILFIDCESAVWQNYILFMYHSSNKKGGRWRILFVAQSDRIVYIYVFFSVRLRYFVNSYYYNPEHFQLEIY